MSGLKQEVDGFVGFGKHGQYIAEIFPEGERHWYDPYIPEGYGPNLPPDTLDNYTRVGSLSELGGVSTLYVALHPPYPEDVRQFITEELSDDTLVIDLGSVMSEYTAPFYEQSGHKKYALVHTTFGRSTGLDITDKVIIVSSEGFPGEGFPEVEAKIKRWKAIGAVVLKRNPDEHDQLISGHGLVFSHAKADNNIRLKVDRRGSTTSTQAYWDLVKSINEESAALVANVMSNGYAQEHMVESLLSALRDLCCGLPLSERLLADPYRSAVLTERAQELDELTAHFRRRVMVEVSRARSVVSEQVVA